MKIRTRHSLCAKSFLAACFLFCMATEPARAEFGAQVVSQKPDTAQPLDIAMIYYRYSGQTPPLPAWAEQTDDYKNAADFDKDAVRAQKARELEQSFRLLGQGEQIVVDYTAALSDYSLASKGYLIENFKADTYFAFSYAGEDFAIVPRDIEDRGWLSVDGLPAKAIDDLRLASKSGKDVVLTMFLSPTFADAKTVDLEGKPYHVISADIVNMAFFDQKGVMVWHQEQTPAQSPENQARTNELMKLYR